MSGKRREAGSGEPLAIASQAFSMPGLSVERMPLHMRALEPRILLDAAAVETAEDAMLEAVHGPLADAYLEHEFKPIAPIGQQADIEDDELIPPFTAPSEQIAFIAADVADVETIVAGLPSDTEVVLLSAEDDGVARIVDVLDGRTGLDAIHIISHGSAGSLNLGTATLDATTMAGIHAERLGAIGASLGEAGDILLYGCNFAEGETGEAAAQMLADLTDADIAASDDATGHAALGGDWVLEQQTGTVETRALDAGDDWHGVLDETFEALSGGDPSVDNDEAVGSDRIVGQTFSHAVPPIEGSTYDVDRIDLYLRLPAGGPQQDITLSLRNTFTGSDLATKTISSTALAGFYKWERFEFSTPATLSSNVTYVMVLETNSSSKTVEWATQDGNQYGNGTFIKDDGTPEPDSDAMFRIKGEYNDPPASNTAPVITSYGGADAATQSVDENETFITTVTATDPDVGDTLTYSLLNTPESALFRIDPTTGQLSFRNAPDFENPTGPNADQIYEVWVEARDGFGGRDSQFVQVTIRNVNEAPTGTNVAWSGITNEDSVAVGTVMMTDPDAGDVVKATIGTDPANGSVTIDKDTGAYRYTPDPDYVGTDRFTVIVSDAGGLTDTVTIDVTVLPVNDAPVALGGKADAEAGQPVRLSAEAFDFDDIEGDELISVTLRALDLAGGALVHSGNVVVGEGATLTMAELDTLVFTPASQAFTGQATFAYTANDATPGVTPGVFRINITTAPPPPPPLPEPEPEPEPGPGPVSDVLAPTIAPVVEEADGAEADEDDKDEVETPVASADIVQPDRAPGAQTAAGPPASPGVTARETEVAATGAPPAAEPDLDVQLSNPAPLPVRETVIEPATAPIQINRAGITFTPVDQQALAQDVDRTGEEMREYDEFLGVAVDKVSFAFGSLLSVSGVSFALRGGVLAAALMSAVPAWNRFDPIAIVNQYGEESDEPAETLADTMRTAIEDARGRVDVPA